MTANQPFRGKALRKKASKWAIEKLGATGKKPIYTLSDIERAWLAGYKTGKKDGFVMGDQYANGKWTSVLQNSDSRQELNASTPLTRVGAPACPKKEKKCARQ